MAQWIEIKPFSTNDRCTKQLLVNETDGMRILTSVYLLRKQSKFIYLFDMHLFHRIIAYKLSLRIIVNMSNDTNDSMEMLTQLIVKSFNKH